MKTTKKYSSSTTYVGDKFINRDRWLVGNSVCGCYGVNYRKRTIKVWSELMLERKYEDVLHINSDLVIEVATAPYYTERHSALVVSFKVQNSDKVYHTLFETFKAALVKVL